MDEKTRKQPDAAKAREARLAEQLRVNLQRRKAQLRARRTGEADSREEGLPATGFSRADEDTGR